MKKYISNILLFFCAYVFLHTIIIGLFGKNWTYYRIGSNGHMFSRINEISNYSTPDIMFLGSSHTYRGFDPRFFAKYGITTFNLGSSSQTPKQTEVLLKKYLDVINPKLIIFDVTPTVFNNDGVESTTDLISNDHIDVEICKLAMKTGNIKVINTLIYGLFQEYVFNIRDTYYEDATKEGDRYIPGGFVEKTKYTPFVKTESASNKTIKLDPRKDQLLAFDHCIGMIQDKRIPCLLVLSPLPECTYRRMSNYDVFYERISSYGECIDFNAILHLDDSCFYDSFHLNQHGVCQFNDCLLHVLDTLKFQ